MEILGIYKQDNLTFIQGAGGIQLLEETWMRNSKTILKKKKEKYLIKSQNEKINHFILMQRVNENY
ncbi:MAG: hypothetical protein GXX85_01665 [Ignavibacteria bacterium]|nr:hypothetical protein [Ignavibacteria bacterium]